MASERHGGKPPRIKSRRKRGARRNACQTGRQIEGYASRQIAAMANQALRPGEEPEAVRPRTKTPRNAPCPCGSGLKAKRCCLEREE